ncbi:MAG: hypothetical protein OIF38_01700 [Cellvibrionaceae bacterium]|uniref:hypothetical protein n=1 Tax=Neptunomonas sp. XY-337 TaxID=2561897 RepID=UPI0010AA7843|nr:hypothetical protein [Neptunomonas sp. XY-337]MCV6624778.1 hypothetical protein [Cellvibrionaceae bacterium]
MKLLRHHTKHVIFLLGTLPLAGCMTQLKPSQLALTEIAPDSQGPISIEQLLASARSETSNATSTDLYFSFEPDRHELKPTEQQRLLEFAKQQATPLYLACAPAAHQNRYTAAAIAIQRCQHISVFLSQQTFHNEVMLSPRLQADQVRVHR